MSRSTRPYLPIPSIRPTALIAGALALGLTAVGRSGAQAASAAELLGSNQKSVHRILGEGQDLAGLFNEESSESHSGGIGSTHGYRTRVGYIGGRSCYVFFMKKTGESFNPVEVFGLLYLCANQAEWGELQAHDSSVGFIYRQTPKKGKGATRTYLATLTGSADQLVVYSPQWRPDFNRELWVHPDEAPVHRQVPQAWSKGEVLPSPAGSKGAALPDPRLFGKAGDPPGGKGAAAPSSGGSKGRRPDAKRLIPGAKEGIYLPKARPGCPRSLGQKPHHRWQGGSIQEKQGQGERQRQTWQETRRACAPPDDREVVPPGWLSRGTRVALADLARHRSPSRAAASASTRRRRRWRTGASGQPACRSRPWACTSA